MRREVMTEAASKIKLERGARFYNVGKRPPLSRGVIAERTKHASGAGDFVLRRR
jgi:hypothetical protein